LPAIGVVLDQGGGGVEFYMTTDHATEPWRFRSTFLSSKLGQENAVNIDKVGL